MEMSWLIPNSEQVNGITNNDPPITPEAQQAAIVVRRAKIIARGRETEIPIVWQVICVITAIITAAPLVLIVEPKGIEIEKKSLSNPRLSHNCILMGMFAAELLEKNAVIPLSL